MSYDRHRGTWEKEETGRERNLKNEIARLRTELAARAAEAAALREALEEITLPDTEFNEKYKIVFGAEQRETEKLGIALAALASTPDRITDMVEALEKIADYSLGSTVQPALIAREALAKWKGEGG